MYNSRYRLAIDEAPAGTWVLIGGVDHTVLKSATIIDAENSLPIETLLPIKHNTTPVVKVAIEPHIPSELPKMLEGLRRLNKSYPLLKTKVVYLFYRERERERKILIQLEIIY